MISKGNGGGGGERAFTWMGVRQFQLKLVKDYKERWKVQEQVMDQQQNEMERKLTKKQNIDEFNQSIQRKSLIRYLTVIIDFSSAARK